MRSTCDNPTIYVYRLSIEMKSEPEPSAASWKIVARSADQQLEIGVVARARLAFLVLTFTNKNTPESNTFLDKKYPSIGYISK